MELERNVPMPLLDLHNLRMEELNESQLLEFYGDMELWELKRRVKERFGLVGRSKDIDMKSNNMNEIPF